MSGPTATAAQINQFARDVAAVIRRALGLAAQPVPGWYRPSTLDAAQKARIASEAEPVILRFGRAFPRSSPD